MLIGKLAICWLTCVTWIVFAQYECAYGDGVGDAITLLVVSKDEADTCENCTCKEIQVECLFGPDSIGNFENLNVTQIIADSCERTKCICSSHGSDYIEKAEQRL